MTNHVTMMVSLMVAAAGVWADAPRLMLDDEILWRETSAPRWWESKRVGKVTECVLPVSKDNHFFGVAAMDKAGHSSQAVFPIPSKE